MVAITSVTAGEHDRLAGRYLPAHEGPSTDPLRTTDTEGASSPSRGPLASTWIRGRYVSVQVNVDANGANIVGDAANEPSLAIDPTNPLRMVIGWRQFDSVTSDFRQAGWAYSHDSGRHWTFPGVIEPGVRRSDPVLFSDAGGSFFYLSLGRSGELFTTQLFRSTDGGLSWSRIGPTDFGGDKPWAAVDPTGGIGGGNIYVSWGSIGCCDNRIFMRSVDGGMTFDTPVTIPQQPIWGTISAGPDGTVYVAGKRPLFDNEFIIARSSTIKDPANPLEFDFGAEVDMGGRFLANPGTGPNPDGLYGQVWVATDHSDRPTRGNVYMLCSVTPFDPFNFDPLDVHFVASTNGGLNWSAPVRINDDPVGNFAWQWFGTMSVAPNGRIDVIWNDTRNDITQTYSELYYAYSLDGGITWSENEPVSPPFAHAVGYPNQEKLGDYYHMISDNAGAHVAYAATFNGEQDVYYLRILARDCNENGIPDEEDVANGTSPDCNGNDVPDECELTGNDCNGNQVPDVCDVDAGTSSDCQDDGIPDECQLADQDCNDSGVPDTCELPGNDCDGNGVLDSCELSGRDCNANGRIDACDTAGGFSLDCQGDQIPDECQLADNDCDGSGIPDACELATRDCNGNGVLDSCDVSAGASLDCQGNGQPDECELQQNDCNFNNIPDDCELVGNDCNLTGIPDECELSGNDCNATGIPDECELIGNDCNHNMQPDSCDIASGTSADCQLNGVPDECELAGNDCDGSGVPDECELSGRDCNGNLRLDSCDIAAGSSPDCQLNGTPDECELIGNDCNATGVPDECELAGNDCDGSGVPDECELPGNDCNGNQRLDSCDLASGSSRDCQSNAVPDECELAGNDCNLTGIPDECELAGNDCNANGRPDTCDIVSGASKDCQVNGIPDECELAGNDCDGNSIPDQCELSGRDCDGNHVLDSCELSGRDCDSNAKLDVCELSGRDCDGNHVLDSCELAGRDCNNNGVLDPCDLARGTSQDCQSNGIPDECELAGDDCNGDGVPDTCQITTRDCNRNDRLDSCDIAAGTSADCQSDGRPDECQLLGNDCNQNGEPDECDLIAGTSEDANNNGLLDECEPQPCDLVNVARILPVGGGLGDTFGSAVDIDGEWMLVGAQSFDTSFDRAGASWFYRIQGNDILPGTRVLANDGDRDDRFGWSVSLDGNIAAISAIYDDDVTSNSGSVYVYRLIGQTWTFEAKLSASDPGSGDAFGHSVSVGGDRILIGARYDDDRGSNSGSAYVFRWTGSLWVQEAKLLAADGQPSDFFGSAVALSGTVAVVGAFGEDERGGTAGAAYVYERTGTLWTQKAKLLALDGKTDDWFGAAVATDGDRILVGARYTDEQGSGSGSAYFFQKVAGIWQPAGKILPADGAAGDGFGVAVDLDGSFAIVGADGGDDGATNAGAAYIFAWDGVSWAQQAKILPSVRNSGAQFGIAVGLSGSNGVAGAQYANNLSGVSTGAASLFTGIDDCNRNLGLDACDLVNGLSSDSDGNGRPDECDLTVPGDYDLDGDVDLADYAGFLGCAAGPASVLSASSGNTLRCLGAFDSDGDEDIDLFDFARFQAILQTP